jgi:hypothetical protein
MMRLNIDPTLDKKATESGFSVGLGNPQGGFEGPANLPVDVAVLPENVPQKHQLLMKAILLT